MLPGLEAEVGHTEKNDSCKMLPIQFSFIIIKHDDSSRNNYTNDLIFIHPFISSCQITYGLELLVSGTSEIAKSLPNSKNGTTTTSSHM